jgi:hypothetical protein
MGVGATQFKKKVEIESVGYLIKNKRESYLVFLIRSNTVPVLVIRIKGPDLIFSMV